MLTKRFMRLLPLCLVAFATVIPYGVRCDEIDDEVEQFEVNQILGEVSALMRKHHNVSTNNQILMSPTASGGEMDESTFENDMVLTREQAQMLLESMKSEMAGNNKDKRNIRKTTHKWTFPIKYAFDGTHDANYKNSIREGIKLWEKTTCVRFREYSSVSGNGIIFSQKESKCSSGVGMWSNRPQTVMLGKNCNNIGTICHEIGHALGMYHEHMRSDRESSVRVNVENIIPAYAFAFAKVTDDISYGSPYDPASVMHYNSIIASIDYNAKLRTIESHDPMYLTSMGQRFYLSFNDVRRMNMHYRCYDKCSQSQLAQSCQNGGYQDPNNCAKCICPDGYGGDFCTQGKNSCGRVINIDSCSSTVIASPTSYSAGQTCGWVVKAPSGSELVFGFERQPNMPCNFADMCEDYAEIRTSNNPIDTGKKFCKCGINNGRITVDRNEATVFFRSKQGKGTGFRLVAYATCPGTSASSLTKECVITNTGYDYVGSKSQADNGQTCSSWSIQSTFNAFDFPEGTLAGAGNKCRNPDGRSKPWCHTGSRYSTASCSSIPACPTGGSVPTPTTTEKATTTATTTTTQKSTTSTTTTTASTTTPSSPWGGSSGGSTGDLSGGSTQCRKTQAGREYIGSVTVTISGRQCQRWDTKWPHIHNYNKGSLFPDGALWKASNKCRNPDPDFTEGVWCYTTDKNVERELCDIPMCAQAAPLAERRSFNDHPMRAFWRKLFDEYDFN